MYINIIVLTSDHAPSSPQGALERTLQLRVFEKSLMKVRFWLKSRAEEQLASRCDIGTGVEGVRGLLEQQDKFEGKAKVGVTHTHTHTHTQAHTHYHTLHTLTAPWHSSDTAASYGGPFLWRAAGQC